MQEISPQSDGSGADGAWDRIVFQEIIGTFDDGVVDDAAQWLFAQTRGHGVRFVIAQQGNLEPHGLSEAIVKKEEIPFPSGEMPRLRIVLEGEVVDEGQRPGVEYLATPELVRGEGIYYCPPMPSEDLGPRYIELPRSPEAEE
ncbi:MAG TPA: hypothetical protein VJP80_08140 [Candidatus Saccharimonadales bacterium]|nr:hypothetical protein [Candidatus Saccharimonadales bacterium]